MHGVYFSNSKRRTAVRTGHEPADRRLFWTPPLYEARQLINDSRLNAPGPTSTATLEKIQGWHTKLKFDAGDDGGKTQAQFFFRYEYPLFFNLPTFWAFFFIRPLRSPLSQNQRLKVKDHAQT